MSPDELRSVVSSLGARYRKQQVLLDLAKLSASEFNVVRLLEIIVSKATEVVDADRSALFLLDEKRAELWTIVAEGLRDEHAIIRVGLGTGIAGHVAKSGEHLTIDDPYSDPRFDRTVDSRTGYRTRNLMATPLIGTKGRVLGVLEVINKKTGAFSREDSEFLMAFASTAAARVETAKLYNEIEHLFDSFINVVAHAVDERDPCTAGHSRRVKQYSRALAAAVNGARAGVFAEVHFDEDELRQLEIAALLHDVGKIGVRENVLNKRNRLTDDALTVIEQRIDLYLARRTIDQISCGFPPCDDERIEVREAVEFIWRVATSGFLSVPDAKRLWEIRARGWLDDCEYEHLAVTRGNLTKSEWEHMQTHVTKSHQLLARIPWPKKLERVPDIAHCHHEKLNGKGYPRGLKGDEIPLEAQIVTVADIYDALTAHDRPYKPPMPHERAATILLDQTKEEFLNLHLVRLFLDEGLYKLPPTA